MPAPKRRPPCRRVAVVGAGWAGLAAAVEARTRGAQVTLYEMAPAAGGRARSAAGAAAQAGTTPRDNGQHILIGAYTDTLALMRRVGADPERLLWRGPLALCTPDGHGLRLPAGAPVPAFVRGVLAARGWPLAARLALLRAAGGWLLRGFRCAPGTSVSALCRGLPASIQHDLIEPLCVAALNTPMAQASATVFLRVLRDALFSGPGGADLLLPRAPLSALLPTPALAWLQAQGATLHLGRRVQALAADGAGWQVDGEAFDGVVLACNSTEAARLCATLAPPWSAAAAALPHEPIITVWLHQAGLQLPQPMLALAADAQAPAQFVFDLGALGLAPGEFAFVVSGAAPWVAHGLSATGAAVLAQARLAFPGAFSGPQAQVQRAIAAERRATFACTPGLQRPPAAVAPGLVAAGDYVQGPYPATLEAAVRAGLAAARQLC
ncbi:hydroxysqualene dehydroxylase HpnE [Aquabacterium sp. OR-4]|uniref:hydroxysqualene dehydroxylase HpnE n=1 Tax=Aquabacterium sp. OR-4 TaxID=2978127 RepID=UPI0028C76E88|nr:hydroxysqualene dehydroxylase HpnE [Aquabacterium sp. OR-4]MDT7835245.1 hydroxysqualene dehydroxylase HpnE [Aquabacterium sp. OR-4]